MKIPPVGFPSEIGEISMAQLTSDTASARDDSARRFSSDGLAQTRHRHDRTYNLLAGVYLCLLIGFCVRFMWSSIFRPWFFSSDEYVVVGEVIRFVQLDFRQHFFDMLG